MRPLLSLVALASVALAQVPTRISQHQIGETVQDWYRLEPQQSTQPDEPSAIGPHKVGEPFSEWLRLNNLDLGEICGKHQRSDRSTDYKAVCKKLSLIEEHG